MRAIELKLFRDLGGMKGQMAAVAMVMACGLTMMIMARGMILSLERTRTDYYSTHRFADLFCDLKRAPNSLRPRLAEIPGLAAVDTRVKGSLILDLPGMREPADGTVISLSDERPQQLNLLYLRVGRLPELGSRGEVVVGETFAEAHGFQVGDTIEATIYGAREQLRIVGIALSPEYVFETRAGETLPDHRRFGVFWMNERELAKALDLDGAFNSVIARAAPGVDVRALKSSLDRVLEPYGSLAAYDRTEQASARMIDDRIRILRSFSIAFPAVFLSIAAFMASATLTRLVRLQREQIAQLKAFGYSSATIGWHYFQFSLVAVIAATLIGGLVGLWLGDTVVADFRRFFRFPALFFHPDWPAMAVGLAASAFTSFLGVLGAVRQAMRLPPAEAMRPEPPADFRPSALERLGLQELVSPAFRMALRNLERRPWQASFTALGLAMATAIPIVPGAMRDGLGYMMEFQWQMAQRQDVTLGLIEPGSFGALSAMQHLPGVIRAEPFRMVSARLRSGHRDRRVSITGLPPGARLNRLLDEHGRPVPLPITGLLLSAKLAEVLDLKVGDSVRIEVQEGQRPVLDAVVGGTITDYAGLGAYMEIGALRRLMREGPTVSGAHLRIDAAHRDELFAEVKETPRIGVITMTQDARESFDRTTGEMLGLVQALYFGFAAVVSFGIVYNGARVALSERTRDLATLRVLGFTRREVAGVLIGELAVLTLAALGPGLLIGTKLAQVLLASTSTETIRMPVVLTSQSYATAMLIVLCSSGLSFWVVSRRIRNLDLLSVLKASE